VTGVLIVCERSHAPRAEKQEGMDGTPLASEIQPSELDDDSNESKSREVAVNVERAITGEMGDAQAQSGTDVQSHPGSHEKETGQIEHQPLLKHNRFLWLLCAFCVSQYCVTMPFINTASGILLERNLFVDPPKTCMLQQPDECSSGYLAPVNGNPSVDSSGGACPSGRNFAPVLPLSLNITSQSHPSWDKSHYVFVHLSRNDVDCTDAFWSEACAHDYCSQQAAATEKAGRLQAVPFMITVLTTFPFGDYVVDRAGWRTESLIAAPALAAAAHAMFAFQTTSPILPMLLLGLGYSLAISALWPSVTLVVPPHAKGTAFGIITCIQNVGLTLFPLIVAAIYNNNGRKYLPVVEIFFFICAGFTIVIGISIMVCDRRYGDSKMRVKKIQRRAHPHSVHPISECVLAENK